VTEGAVKSKKAQGTKARQSLGLQKSKAAQNSSKNSLLPISPALSTKNDMRQERLRLAHATTTSAPITINPCLISPPPQPNVRNLKRQKFISNEEAETTSQETDEDDDTNMSKTYKLREKKRRKLVIEEYEELSPKPKAQAASVNKNRGTSSIPLKAEWKPQRAHKVTAMIDPKEKLAVLSPKAHAAKAAYKPKMAEKTVLVDPSENSAVSSPKIRAVNPVQPTRTSPRTSNQPVSLKSAAVPIASKAPKVASKAPLASKSPRTASKAPHVAVKLKVHKAPKKQPVVPPPDVINGEEFYEVEQIVRESGEGAFRMYEVKWIGYPSSDNTWEPAASIAETAPEIVKAYLASKSKF
jgi:Chromo (CHRromatin Organisation MOdifier) domain